MKSMIHWFLLFILGIVPLFSYAQTSSTWPPAVQQGQPQENEIYFNEYPYSIGDDGLFTFRYRKVRLVQFGTHYLYHDPNMQGFIFWLDAAPCTSFNFSAQYTDITRRFYGGYDHYRFYDLFVDYYQIRTPQLVLSWGAGMKGESTGSFKAGAGIHLTIDYYFKKPFSANVRANAGKIGDNWLTQFFFRFNWHYQGNAFFVGYNYFSRGTTNLDGVILGVSVYF